MNNNEDEEVRNQDQNEENECKENLEAGNEDANESIHKTNKYENNINEKENQDNANESLDESSKRVKSSLVSTSETDILETTTCSKQENIKINRLKNVASPEIILYNPEPDVLYKDKENLMPCMCYAIASRTTAHRYVNPLSYYFPYFKNNENESIYINDGSFRFPIIEFDGKKSRIKFNNIRTNEKVMSKEEFESLRVPIDELDESDKYIHFLYCTYCDKIQQRALIYEKNKKDYIETCDGCYREKDKKIKYICFFCEDIEEEIDACGCDYKLNENVKNDLLYHYVLNNSRRDELFIKTDEYKNKVMDELKIMRKNKNKMRKGINT